MTLQRVKQKLFTSNLNVNEGRNTMQSKKQKNGKRKYVGTNHKAKSMVQHSQKQGTTSYKKFSLFPLSLAWGFTVNKVQDLSLPRGIIIFDIHLQKPLNQGPEAEKYEKKSIDKIYLIGTYFSSVITANKDTHVGYGRFQRIAF